MTGTGVCEIDGVCVADAVHVLDNDVDTEFVTVNVLLADTLPVKLEETERLADRVADTERVVD